MTDKLIEAVARAICRAHIKDNPFRQFDVEHEVDSEWFGWSPEAQAALTAITDAGYRIVKDEVVAWMYVRKADAWPYAPTVIQLTRWAEDDDARPYWTEKPLYAALGDEK